LNHQKTDEYIYQSLLKKVILLMIQENQFFFFQNMRKDMNFEYQVGLFVSRHKIQQLRYVNQTIIHETYNDKIINQIYKNLKDLFME
jgi:hypothetical protein